MYRTSYYIIILSFLLTLTGSLPAGSNVWDGEGADDNWCTEDNWSADVTPSSADYVYFGDWSANSSGPAVIDSNSSCAVEGKTIYVGVHNAYPGYLNINANGLAAVGNLYMGFNTDSNGTITINGGNSTTDGAVVVGEDGTGVLIMNGGTLTATWQLLIGHVSGTGHVQLNGGTLWVRALTIGSGSGGTGTMDITGGLLKMKWDLSQTVNDYVDAGLITAYGGRSEVKVVYDPNTEFTFVSATPADVNVAWGATPANGGILNGEFRDDPNARIIWFRGDSAASHDVYFGENFNDVNDATIGNPLGVYKGRQADAGEPNGRNSYDTGGLVPAHIYYWRIDEVEADGTTVYKGTIWRFSVTNSIAVDLFDSYADTNDLLAVWTSSGPNNVELETTQSLITGSMMVNFSNAGSVSRDAPFADWTQAGVEALTLFFHGSANNGANARQLYVKLQDSATSATVTYDGDANDLVQNSWDGWNMWNIVLSDFSGVDLTDITKVTVGITGTSSDTVYFDDMRIYIPRCEPGLTVGDFTGDCIANMDDLQIMVQNWLETGSYTTGIDGELINFPTDDSQWVSGYSANALSFDGNDVYVNMGDVEELKLTDALTLSAWVKLASIPSEGSVLMAGKVGSYWLEWNKNEWLSFGTFIDGNQDSSGATIHLADGNWHHLAITYDGTTKYGYHNGIPLFMKTLPGKITSEWVHDFEIGAGFPPSSTVYDGCPDGLIDDVRVYDYALSWNEVKYLADTGGTAPAVAPVGWWKLDETSGITAEDSGSNAGNPVYTPMIRPEVDLNDDGRVNFADYAALAGKWLELQLWP